MLKFLKKFLYYKCLIQHKYDRKMTQKDKQLLLKDLCARVPYGPVICTWYDKGINIKCVSVNVYTDVVELDIPEDDEARVFIDNVKPYLFPLSSLTEEQRNNISKLLIDTQNELSPYGEINMKGCDNLFICSVKQSNALINYCLANHLDINGLIEKGLAIDATGLNIYC